MLPPPKRSNIQKQGLTHLSGAAVFLGCVGVTGATALTLGFFQKRRPKENARAGRGGTGEELHDGVGVSLLHKVKGPDLFLGNSLLLIELLI